MAQQGIAREAMVEHCMKSFYFIDPLAGEDALAIEVLIRIRDSARVDVETMLSRVDGRQPRAGRRLHRDPDARLQDAITFRDNASVGIDHRLTQRMRNRPDQLCRGAAR